MISTTCCWQFPFVFGNDYLLYKNLIVLNDWKAPHKQFISTFLNITESFESLIVE